MAVDAYCAELGVSVTLCVKITCTVSAALHSCLDDSKETRGEAWERMVAEGRLGDETN